MVLHIPSLVGLIILARSFDQVLGKFCALVLFSCLFCFIVLLLYVYIFFPLLGVISFTVISPVRITVLAFSGWANFTHTHTSELELSLGFFVETKHPTARLLPEDATVLAIVISMSITFYNLAINL